MNKFLISPPFWNGVSALMVIYLICSMTWKRHRIFTAIQVLQLLEIPLLYWLSIEDPQHEWQVWHDLWKANIGLGMCAAFSIALERWPWALTSLVMMSHSGLKMAKYWNYNADLQFTEDDMLTAIRWTNRAIILLVIWATYTEHGETVAEENDDARTREAPARWGVRTKAD